MVTYQDAAERLLARLMIWHKLYRYHSEIGDVEVTLHIADLWDSADQAAVDQFVAARAEITGQRPLPFEVIQ